MKSHHIKITRTFLFSLALFITPSLTDARNVSTSTGTSRPTGFIHQKNVFPKHNIPSKPSSFYSTSAVDTYDPLNLRVSTSLSSSISNVSKGGGGGKGVATNISNTLNFPRISITTTCTLLTWFLQRQYTNVMASSALTLITCMCFNNKALTQAAFCGTFAGMASMTIIPTWQYALSLGVITSVLYEVLIGAKNAFVGIGGRLGATAFIGSLIMAFVQSTPTGISLSSMMKSNVLSLLQTKIVLSMTLWHAIGSVGTILLREIGDDTTAKDPVRASAIMGLIGSLFLYKNKVAALALYGGSFVGMSAPNRLLHGLGGKEYPKITPFALFIAFGVAGALGGLIHGLSIELGFFIGGWGGKAGFCAFLGCLSYRAFMTIISKR